MSVISFYKFISIRKNVMEIIFQEHIFQGFMGIGLKIPEGPVEVKIDMPVFFHDANVVKKPVVLFCVKSQINK